MTKKKYKSKWLAAVLAAVMLITSLPLTAMAAPASDIPKEMLDNVYLDALAYTGYNVQAQKNDGTIFKKHGSSVSASIRSNIGYGTGPSGLETVSSASTVSGKAPNIAKFEANGLCCASYVSYVWYNYMPNVAGIDTSGVPCPSNPRSPISYNSAADDWVKSGKARRIGFTQNSDGTNFKPSEEIPIGSLIVFKHIPTGKIAHVAIYAGYYDGKYFVTHVGNDRGPEFNTIVGMSKGDYPEAVVQIVAPEFVEAYGAIEVQKNDTDGKGLAGAYFVATSINDSSLQYLIGPTNSSGYAISEERVPYGQYLCKETVFPTDYRAYGKTEWTVTVNENNNGIAKFTAVNEIIPGSAKIVKTSEDGTIGGVSFTIKGNGIDKTVTTNASGEVQIDNLKPGTYKVTEAVADKYVPQETRNVTVVSNKVATVTFNNVLKRSNLKVVKTSEDNLVEGIKFHLYGTSLSGLPVDEYAVTDKDGVAVFKDVLVSGHESYTLEEVDTAERYIIPESQRTAVEWNKVLEKSFYNELKRGDLTVKKSSEDGFAEGMKFHLYGTSFSGLPVDEYAVTDKNGVAYFKDILIGTGYTLEEVNTPVRYVIPDRQTADITWNEVAEAEFENVLKKWRADVYKLDKELAGKSGSEEKAAIPMVMSAASELTTDELGYPYGFTQGDATLAGAVYGVYKGEVLIDTYTTDENGYFLTKYYPCGEDWTIREISPSEGYMLDPTVYHMEASPWDFSFELNTIYPDVYEEIIKGDIAIIKHTDDGSTQIETPEKGAKFEVFLKAAGSYDNAKETERDIIICDKNGFGQTDMLPYGIYTVHQVSGWEGRELMPDFDVFISKDGQTYHYIINNANFQSYVKVVKIDAETGKPIPYAGAGFKIINPDGEIVTMSYTYPTPSTIDTFYTDANGSLVTPEKLPYGKGYSLVEVEAPHGYVLDGNPLKFDITQKNSAEEDGITVVKANKANKPQKCTITIEKTGEAFFSTEVIGYEDTVIYKPVYKETRLSGAVFEIRAAEDIYTPDGTLRFSKGMLVDTVTTDKDGLAKSCELYLGKYEIKETKAPYGMVLSNEIHTAELTYAGQNIAVTETIASVSNKRQKAVIRLLKQLESDKHYSIGVRDEYVNIKFGLYAAEIITAADGTQIPKDGLLEIAGIDENGMAVFTVDVPVGAKLYVKEYATDSHYLLSETAYPVEFVYADSSVATVQIVVNNGKAIDNVIIRGSIKGLKVDEENYPVANAVFGLFKPDETEFNTETALATATSDENGLFEFDGVPYGKWVIKELSCPEHLVLSDELLEVTISEQDQVAHLTVVNKFISGKVQITKVNGKNHNEKLSGAVFELYVDTNRNGVFDVGVDTLYGTLEETDTGIYELMGLGYNGYFIYEAKAPEGFTKDDRYFFFEITKDGDTVVVENEIGVGFVNDPVPVPEVPTTEVPTSPQTGDDSHIWLWITLASASLAAIGIMIVLNRKKRKSI